MSPTKKTGRPGTRAKKAARRSTRAARPSTRTVARGARSARVSGRSARPTPRIVARAAGITTTPVEHSPRQAPHGLKLVAPRRPAAKPKSKRKTGRPADVGTKQRLLLDLMHSRAAVLAAIRGLSAETAERPLGESKWNVREVVLHLYIRDRARLHEMESTLRGNPASWFGHRPADWNRANAQDLAPLRRLGWQEALRLLRSTRMELLEAIESVPEEPAEMWTEEHPFGWMLHGLPRHDVHHAGAIRSWRSEQGV